eukprot:TRINITY_DN26155_c0_g3_i1.p1 TRINITY_DN26155_c0_g3~~TRINITY_DN26155_c0_g3_i1.p1  ORF type:complete len:416 (+),score=96.80 TRINITY_DN26155_c0_g3_i1:37-1248(+)
MADAVPGSAAVPCSSRSPKGEAGLHALSVSMELAGSHSSGWGQKMRSALRLAALAATLMAVVSWAPVKQRLQDVKRLTIAAGPAVLDATAIDLMLQNYFQHHRARIVWEINSKIFSSNGPIVDSINKAAGARLTVSGLSFNSSVPHFDFLSMKLTRQRLRPMLELEVEVRCQSGLTIELDGVRHAGVVTREGREIRSSTAARLAQRTASAVLERWEGDKDYRVNFQIRGHVQGRTRLFLLMRAAAWDPLPQAVHFALLDTADLTLVLDDYTMLHNRGIGRWIKRLHLVPLNLLERLANNALQNFMRENRDGWPIKPPDVSEVAEKQAALSLAQTAESLFAELKQVREDRADLEDRVCELEGQLEQAKTDRKHQQQKQQQQQQQPQAAQAASCSMSRQAPPHAT